ncbi:hypothetical protein KXD93_25675 [Mucilaginibacter sp. BJC16-A38]|uniref:hypothetical protein n=1 Tax=Mucilaginibacter phenanthrenivorans TaxID=1234842 RepID=UPI0021570402|nr:hypothetical protein [Mucilaginibacter phenanthrenivorans]MCR8561073.1 hypothetical protein [Mucilaginibacter phenanthrenivorans]
MKKHSILALIPIAVLFFSCGKSSTNNNNQTGPTGPVTVANTTTYPNGYVVKSIGFSRIVLSVDKNDKLIAAELYGGGNKVILKPGSGNTVEMLGSGSYSVLPSGFQPDGEAQNIDAAIDNSTMPKDTTGGQGLCIKIKGFDKQQTGYNQINLVMDKLVRATPPGTAGYFDNIAYMAYNSTRKNKDYPGAFFKSLFTGNMTVADVEIAQPLSAKPYITEDVVMPEGQAIYSYLQVKSFRTRFVSSTFFVTFETAPPASFSFGGPLNYEWVNANNGTVTRYDDYSYTLYFPNIKSYDQVVEPGDTTSKVFLRIRGFDPAVTGFNQLRVFIAKGIGSDDGGLPFLISEKQTSTPTFSMAKQAFLPQGVFCYYAAPLVPHY